MPPLILLAVIGLLPLLLFIMLRVKPLYLFVSIVCGYFAVQFLSDSASLVLRSLIHSNQVGAIIPIVLLLLPLLITLFLMRKTLSPASLPFQFILLVANSLLLVTFLLPLLPLGAQFGIYATKSGDILRQAHDVIITGVAAAHVLVMWIMRPRQDEHGKHKKH